MTKEELRTYIRQLTAEIVALAKTEANASERRRLAGEIERTNATLAALRRGEKAPEVETVSAVAPRVRQAIDLREDFAPADMRWGGSRNLRGQILGLFREAGRRRA